MLSPKIGPARADTAVSQSADGWDTIAKRIRQYTTQIFLISIAIGFAFLLVELALIDHIRGTQLIAVVACVLGVGLSLAGLMPRRDVRRAVTILLAALALSGVYGFIEHQQGRAERAGEVAEVAPVAGDDVVGEALESFASNPPALAPLALSGFAIFGVLTLLSAEALPAARAAQPTRRPSA